MLLLRLGLLLVALLHLTDASPLPTPVRPRALRSTATSSSSSAPWFARRFVAPPGVRVRLPSQATATVFPLRRPQWRAPRRRKELVAYRRAVLSRRGNLEAEREPSSASLASRALSRARGAVPTASSRAACYASPSRGNGTSTSTGRGGASGAPTGSRGGGGVGGGGGRAEPHPSPPSPRGDGWNSTGVCFPALNFSMPASVPASLETLGSWWCAPESEYAFLGFSYSVSSCPSASDLARDFARQRADWSARYVRIYGGCDRPNFTDDVVEAAWRSGLGLHLLVWFGFDGGDAWKRRKRALLDAVRFNPKAAWVVRGIAVGSEPLFDNVLSADELAQQIQQIQDELKEIRLASLGQLNSTQSPSTFATPQRPPTPVVTISEMPYGFTSHADAPQIFAAQDVSQANVLPFFDARATTASASWAFVSSAADYLRQKAEGKKVYFTQTGWPSNDQVWKPNSDKAVASVREEEAYFSSLDDRCEVFKQQPGGGVGWFAHIYSDQDLPGWGVLDSQLKPKFRFKPRIEC